MKRWFLTAALCSAAVAVCGQSAPGFTASVKRARVPDDGTQGWGLRGVDGIHTISASVRFMLQMAFDLNPYEVPSGLPAWAESERFDINARADGPLTNWSDRRLLLRRILEQRFGLVTHVENRPADVFVLVRTKPGQRLPKGLQPARCLDNGARPEPGSPPPCRIHEGTNRISSDGISMARLADILGNVQKRRVFDETGLIGLYTFDLHFAWAARPSVDDDAPDVVTALKEQLELALVPQKRAMPVVVVDRVQRPASD